MRRQTVTFAGVVAGASVQHRRSGLVLALLWSAALVGWGLGSPARAQNSGVQAAASTPAMITQPIDAAKLVRLSGNTRPEATARNDRGRVPDALTLSHMQLLLRRPAQREVSLRQLIHALHDRASPQFHHWLDAAALARNYGPSGRDIATIEGWLRQQGFSIDGESLSGQVIDFSGNAGQVRQAFHSEIHYLYVGGRTHIANMSDPQIPAALAPAVQGVVSLHDFRPHPLHRARAAYTVSSNQTLVAPADLATIYNLQPLFMAGYAGQGQTVVVIEDTDVYSTADWSRFRSAFGLDVSYPSGALSQLHPAPASGRNDCQDPGVVPGGVEEEAILDAEWASAAAPGASIQVASCADSRTTFGGLIALQNLLSQPTPPAIVSISYGDCEADNGATANAAYLDTYQQAAAQGVSVFVAAGDAGAAACDEATSYATHGVAVSGYASTPYDVAVGGTDFGDTYTHSGAQYWSSTNSAYYGSALSYVPEVPWNDSCAGGLLSAYEGYGTSAGSNGFCNSSAGMTFLTTTAGSGGPSGCATGSPSISGVVSGSCAGTAKPGWQAGVPGIANDAVRDLPDLSLFSGNGLWGHYYVVCWSDTAAGGKSCSGAPSSWSGAGGTSFASPVLAGIQALVNQRTGARQGNPDYVYYELAASQAASGLSCNSSAGNGVASGCVFYNVTSGDIDVNCRGSNDCYLPSGSNGVLTASNAGDSIAYAAGTGWNFATGLGSVNAYNLASYWDSSDLSLNGSGSVNSDGEIDYTLSIGNAGPQAATAVVVTSTLPTGVSLDGAASSTGCTQSGDILSCSVGNLATGTSAPLTIVLNPGEISGLDLTFSVASPAGDLDAANDVLAIDVSAAGNAPSKDDAPLPPWSGVCLGGLLVLIGWWRQRSTSISRLRPHP